MRHLTAEQIEDLLAGRSPSADEHCDCSFCRTRLGEAMAIRRRLRRAFRNVRPPKEMREAVFRLVRAFDGHRVNTGALEQPESGYSVKAQVEIDAGACGFRTQGLAQSEDGQHVSLSIQTDCEKIGQLAAALADRQPLDAYQEISPAGESVFMATVRDTLKGCCAGCAVPAGLFKAMQVAAGLALPKDISITLVKE